MARLLAVLVIQPPGLGGRPSCGHFCRATANASCTASSATSMSPKTRISVATDRPESSRKIRPTSASSTFGLNALTRVDAGKRTDFDRDLDDARDLRCPRERRVEILGPDDVEP